MDNSLVETLRPDSEGEAAWPNRHSRPVRDGHWVPASPTPLAEPFLVAHSEDFAAELGFDAEDCSSPAFTRFLSGDLSDVPEAVAWSTPYAVSVRGNPIPAPDQFNGQGYGDGRAISVGELVADKGRWELQLKGAGKTPFSRGFDGRAVLRSSVREFLVSEAMHHLGVPTTRALSLVASKTDYVDRAWYDTSTTFRNPKNFPPNTLVKERCAITCRAAPSFLRVGQVELFARRMMVTENGEEMRELLRHAILREFPHIFEETSDFDATGPAIVALVREVAERHAALSAHWMRVGYVQGNMNSDNCLLGGRTMDYGPFGFMERYDPLWSPFTSDPDRGFGFERQPAAAHVNVATLARAVVPLLRLHERADPLLDDLQRVVSVHYPEMLAAELGEMRRLKLGLQSWSEDREEELWHPLFAMLKGIDFTIFWRELAKLTPEIAAKGDDAMLQVAWAPAAYDQEDAEQQVKFCDWAKVWIQHVEEEKVLAAHRQAGMRAVSPKYVPREWMLAEAYNQAEEGDLREVAALQALFRDPYAEHPELEARYYLKTPSAQQHRPGISFYS